MSRYYPVRVSRGHPEWHRACALRAYIRFLPCIFDLQNSPRRGAKVVPVEHHSNAWVQRRQVRILSTVLEFRSIVRHPAPHPPAQNKPLPSPLWSFLIGWHGEAFPPRGLSTSMLLPASETRDIYIYSTYTPEAADSRIYSTPRGPGRVRCMEGAEGDREEAIVSSHCVPCAHVACIHAACVPPLQPRGKGNKKTGLLRAKHGGVCS